MPKAPAYTTHVLLLAFQDSDPELVKGIHKLSTVMRNSLGWKPSIYWIGSTDQKAAEEKLDNVAKSLRSNVKHPEENVILYYAGYLTTTAGVLADVSSEATSRRDSAEPVLHIKCPWDIAWRPRPAFDCCANCSLKIDPKPFFKEFFQMPNDVLLLLDSGSADNINLEEWAKDNTRVLSTTDSRKRLVQAVAMGGTTKLKMTPADNECKQCSTKMVFRVESEGQPARTSMLADHLEVVAKKSGTDVGEFMADSPEGFMGINVQTSTKGRILGRGKMMLAHQKPVTTSTVRPIPRYKDVHAVLIWWPTEGDENAFRVDLLQDTFRTYFNYDAQALVLPEKHDDHVRWLGYDGWVGEKLQALVRDHGQKDKLIIVYYAGHGAASETSKHLRGWKYHDAADNPSFDISRVQALLRDCCEADVLLILDTCNAASIPENGDRSFSAIGTQPDHIMETLAACPSKAYASRAPPHTFTRRLAGQLILHAKEQDMTVDQHNSILVHDSRHGRAFDKLPDYDDSTENVRILNCGRGSIVLQPLPDREAEIKDESVEGEE